MRYFLIILLGCTLAFAATFNGPAYSQRHVSYCDKAVSTADAFTCVNKSYQDSQNRLSAVFKEVVEGQDEAGRTRLSAAQKDWIIYRDAQCSWEAGLSEVAALERVYELSCLTGLTEKRIAALERNLSQQETAEPPEFGTHPRWMSALAHDYPDIFWRYGEWKSVDMDCNGTDEQIMTGIAVAQIQDRVKISDQAVSQDTHHEVEVVIAISDNPVTGRPKASLLKIPVSGTETDGPRLCRPSVRLETRRSEAPAADDARSDKDKDAARPAAACHASLKVSDRLCPPLTIIWNGTDYVFKDGEAKTAGEGKAL